MSASMMKAVVTAGHGGFDRLEVQDVPVPVAEHRVYRLGRIRVPHPDLAHRRNDIRPVVANTFPLEAIAEAQRAFLERRGVGKSRPHPIGGTIQPPRPIDLIRERGV